MTRLPLPTLSVVIPSFNQAAFLARALDSVIAQDYAGVEIIVIDGGSTDGTRELLERRAGEIARWISEPDEGQTHALNKGFALATGSIRGWLNCDERYRPGALRAVGEAFAAQPKLDVVFGHRVLVDEAGHEIGRARQPSMHPAKYALFASGLLYSDATFWTSGVHSQTGTLNQIDNARYGMDFDWFSRLALNVRRWKRIDAYLSEFSEHPGRVTFDVPEMPAIARDIRLRTLKLAAVPQWRVALASPYYLARSRYGRLGLPGLLRLPSIQSVRRVAGYIR
jgi:glycosyltransferase involved in cell wall biosynthesis